MKIQSMACVAALFLALLAGADARPEPAQIAKQGSKKMDGLYALKTSTLEGQPADLSQYAGKVALVVNVASACGYTPQYEGLEALQKQYASKGLVVLGFPSNEFGGQEPGTPQEIRTFCSTKFHVTFPMFSKVEVKPGPGQSPVYKFLTAGGKVPNWNFCKYLVGADGRVLEFFPSAVKPDAPELRTAIDDALKTAHPAQ